MKNFPTCPKHSNSTGAVLPELAIALPVGLAFLLFIYWFFVTLTWRNALRDAVIISVDLAQSRGDAVNMGQRPESNIGGDGSGMISALDDYHATGKWIPELGEIGAPGLLAGGEGTAALAAEKAYQLQLIHLGWPLNASDLNDFNIKNLYAMAYAYEIIRGRIGNSLRFPCDPNPVNDPSAGQGCLICTPADLSLLGRPDGDDLVSGEGAFNFIFGIRCTMQPNDIILSPIFRMLGGLGAEPIIISFSSIESLN